MATLRKDGRYQAKVQLGKGADGKYKEKPFYSRISPEDAEQQADEYYNKYIIRDYSLLTVTQYIKMYLDTRRPTILPNGTLKKEDGKLSPTTIEGYENQLNKHIDPYIGDILWGELSSKEIKNWIRKLKDKEVGARTIEASYKFVKSVYNYSVEEEDIGENPLKGSPRKISGYVPKIVGYIPKEHFWEIFEYANTRMQAIMFIIWGTGWREGEIAGLQWTDIEKERSIITLRRNIIRTKQGLVIKALKNGKDRVTFISDEIFEVLEKLPKTSIFVFPNSLGNIQDPNIIGKQFEKVCAKAGYDYHIHQLRHSHGTYAAANNVNLFALKQRMGHSDIKTTEGYIHSDVSIQKEIANLGVFKRKS